MAGEFEPTQRERDPFLAPVSIPLVRGSLKAPIPGTHLVRARFDSTADTAKSRGFPAPLAGAGR